MRKARTSNISTAQQLKTAATKLFAQYGYEGTTVRAIAKEAGFAAGQITANFKSKENLFNEILMDVYHSVCENYDPIIGEIEYLKKNNALDEKAAWRLIEQIIDMQIGYVLDKAHFDYVNIMNIYTLDDNMVTSRMLRQATKNKIEDTLAILLQVVFRQKKILHAKTISRAANGAIVSIASVREFLVDEVLASQYMPQSEEWMKEYIKSYTMSALRAEAEKEYAD